MKQYQVVKFLSDGAYRNEQYIYRNKDKQVTLEVVMNMYAEEGWSVKAITPYEDGFEYGYNFFVIFER